ncbi:hypothetical protein EPD60_07270 [Flaviaesturariibacter flavus]|uniref:PBCV-specific basic adaptor domain-containing protein n=1 Tax=Flaviaesturariibacter flavus TaxID=2502780 RepID=A0A4R1BH95_9BACT|nr:hypothetical protein [Flaviaesturariibacter flavus]TCJ16537.1 hypothetical protein EPD60_07270 [Flaviaesturariibacter flavus]
MKKVLVLCSALLLGTAALHAQTTDDIKSTPTKQKEEHSDGTKVKVKPKTTAKDKAYNVVHRNKKRSSGTKAKMKSADGEKTRVQTKTSESTIRKDN